VQDANKNSLTVTVVVGDGNVLSSCGDSIRIKIALLLIENFGKSETPPTLGGVSVLSHHQTD